MTSQHSDGVAFEHKIEPVPSSDKMALDLDINGKSNRDETNNDVFDEPNVNKDAVAESDEVALEVGLNGDANSEAFSANKIIVSQPIEIATESQSTEPSPSSLPNSSLPLDSNTTNTDLNLSSLEVQPLETSANFDSTDSAIEAAVEDTAPTTSVPPVVESQESDLRHSSTSIAPAESLIPSEQNQLANLNLDSQDSLPSPPAENATNVVESADADLAFTSEPVTTTQEPSRSPKSEKMDDEEFGLPVRHGEGPEAAGEQSDTNMLDAYPVPTKVSRGRESDDEAEPSAKRTKTDDIEMTDDVSAHAENGETSAQEGAKLTDYQVKEIVKVLRNVLRTKAGGDIKQPVATMWPSLTESYLAKVSHPTDLETIEKNLKSGALKTMEDFKTEVDYLYNNSVLYNGAEHVVSIRIRDTRDSILRKVASIPTETVAMPKKEKKARNSTPLGDAAPRAPARRAARDPPAPVTADQTFALDPTTNTPLIRRDSTKGDGGRPKREIHPPKNKDLPYSVRPKGKKHSTELKFCEDVLTEILKPKYYGANWPFVAPVDPVALNIPNYFQVIKKPMDLSSIDKKLKQGQYEKAAEFEKDFRLMLSNCYKFNPPPNNIYNIGKDLESIFDEQWARKDDYISQHSPAAATPGSDNESEDEDEEEDDAGGQQAAMGTLMSLKERLLDEQTKLIQLMNNKSTDPSILLMQQDMVDLIKKRLEATEALAKKPAKKAKAQKPKKAAAPAKRISTKKSGSSRQRYMGTLEKETISNGLGLLPDGIMENVVAMIKAERPEVENETDGTMELDIDIISVPLLWKIHGLIMQYNPEVEQHLKDQMRAEHDGPRALAKAGPKKKNKPMSKGEQERKIQELTEKANLFQRGSQSQEPMQTVETQEEESSGDEESDSEEE